jgi:hypothetical protein
VKKHTAAGEVNRNVDQKVVIIPKRLVNLAVRNEAAGPMQRRSPGG